jgi:hypothetical protein
MNQPIIDQLIANHKTMVAIQPHLRTKHLRRRVKKLIIRLDKQIKGASPPSTPTPFNPRINESEVLGAP